VVVVVVPSLLPSFCCGWRLPSRCHLRTSAVLSSLLLPLPLPLPSLRRSAVATRHFVVVVDFASVGVIGVTVAVGRWSLW
jgi:hypothetical protein